MTLQKQQLIELRNQLIEEKKSLEHEMKFNDNFGLENTIQERLELSNYDNHPADIGTEVFERSKDLALNALAEHRLVDIDLALERMNEGTYGRCITCHAEIPFERLQVVPETGYCIDHVPVPDVSNSRPVEEEFLMPPFGRTSFDEKDDETEFDGEDAWQEVARWGTSNSPAYAEDNEVVEYSQVYNEAGEPIGYVEQLEGFIITDIYGNAVDFANNSAYRAYVDRNEGDTTLMEGEPGDQEGQSTPY